MTEEEALNDMHALMVKFSTLPSTPSIPLRSGCFFAQEGYSSHRFRLLSWIVRPPKIVANSTVASTNLTDSSPILDRNRRA